MKTKQYNPLGMSPTFQIPESVDEFDTLAKRAGACLDEAVANIMYRGPFADWRDMFLHGFEANGSKFDGIDKQTGIERKTKVVELTSKNEDGSPKTREAYDESEAVYWNRVKTSLVQAGRFPSEEAVIANFQPWAQQVADAITFDPSQAERKERGPKKVPKQYIELAQRYIDQGKADVLAKKLTKWLGREVGIAVEVLAQAIKDDQDRRAKEQMDKLLAEA